MQSYNVSMHPIWIRYFELSYLASYYRWSAFRAYPATGDRCPLTGLQYRSSSDNVHHIAAKKANISMSKVYLTAARELRLRINTINNTN